MGKILVNSIKALPLFLMLAGCAGQSPMSENAPALLEKGKGALAVRDEGGKGYAVVSNVRDGLYAGILSENQDRGIVAGINSHEVPGFDMMLPEDAAHINVGFEGDGAPRLRLSRPATHPSITLTTDERGAGLLLMAGSKKGEAAKETPTIKLGFKIKDGREYPVAELKAANRKSGVSTSFDENDLPRIELKDAQGRPRFVLALGPDGAGYIEMLDAEGKPTWSAK